MRYGLHTLFHYNNITPAWNTKQRKTKHASLG